MPIFEPEDQRVDEFELSVNGSPDSGVTLRVRAELDMATVEGFEPALERAIAVSEGPVVLDFAECRFVDSIGVRALIRGGHALAERGRVLRIVGAHDQVRQLFGVIALDEATAIEFDDRPNGYP